MRGKLFLELVALHFGLHNSTPVTKNECPRSNANQFAKLMTSLCLFFVLPFCPSWCDNQFFSWHAPNNKPTIQFGRTGTVDLFSLSRSRTTLAATPARPWRFVCSRLLADCFRCGFEWKWKWKFWQDVGENRKLRCWNLKLMLACEVK